MTTTKIDFYSKWATEHMEIDMDEKGLFCLVCSERHEHVSYTVRVDESQVVPVATSCNCPSVKPCKHMHLVDALYARLYKSNVAKAEAKAAEQEQAAQVEREQVWDKDLACLIYSDTREVVDQAAYEARLKPQIEAYEREQSKVTDLSTRGNFGSRPFSILKTA